MLTPVEAKDAATAVREIIQAQRLEMPEELKNRDQSPPIFPFFRGVSSMTNPGAVDSSSSLLEEKLRQLANAGLKEGPLTSPGTYIAIVEQPSLVELGVRESVDPGSLFVIWGAY